MTRRTPRSSKSRWWPKKPKSVGIYSQFFRRINGRFRVEDDEEEEVVVLMLVGVALLLFLIGVKKKKKKRKKRDEVTTGRSVGGTPPPYRDTFLASFVPATNQ